jgi:hypothetical protein
LAPTFRGLSLARDFVLCQTYEKVAQVVEHLPSKQTPLPPKLKQQHQNKKLLNSQSGVVVETITRDRMVWRAGYMSTGVSNKLRV